MQCYTKTGSKVQKVKVNTKKFLDYGEDWADIAKAVNEEKASEVVETINGEINKV